MEEGKSEGEKEGERREGGTEVKRGRSGLLCVISSPSPFSPSLIPGCGIHY